MDSDHGFVFKSDQSGGLRHRDLQKPYSIERWERAQRDGMKRR